MAVLELFKSKRQQVPDQRDKKRAYRNFHSTPCAKPRICIAGKAGTKVKFRLEFLEGRLHLPIIRVERI